MKVTATNFWPIFFSLALMLLAVPSVFAQDADTLDVAQGYETLNLAIQGDTLVGGVPKNANRVYRLERGGYYLLNGTIRGFGSVPLRIVAAKGTAPRPVLIPIATQTGKGLRVFRPSTDGYWEGMYISGMDNLGNQCEENMFRLDKKNGRFVIKNCYMDGDAQNFIRMNAEGQKVFVMDCYVRNSYLLADPNNGRFLDTRGNTQDTIFVQNCTFQTSSSDPLRSGDGLIKTFIMDHTTLYQTAANDGEFDVNRAVNCIFTNNLLIDFGYEGRAKSDTLNEVVIPIDTLKAPALATDDKRTYTIRNNVMGWTSQWLAWLESKKDSLTAYTFFDQRGKRFIDTYPNMNEENNIYENVALADAPDPAVMLAYIEHRWNTARSNLNNPDLRSDRNGVGTLTENPQTFGPAEDDYNFDYPTSAKAYTHADGGLPAGDLNWFPDKKAVWQQLQTGVVWKNEHQASPNQFALLSNYPNPFNPSTTISFRLSTTAPVRLDIYNGLGQKVRTLLNKTATAGPHSVGWDGRDEAGRLMASGLYIYRLESNNQVRMHKMLLLK